MQEHRKFVYQQLIIWHASESVKEIAKAAAERDIFAIERQEASYERQLAEEERILIREAREESSSHGRHIAEMLAEIQRRMQTLENGRKGLSLQLIYSFCLFMLILPLDDAFHRITLWISLPSFASHFDDTRRLRTEGTARWLLEDTTYQQWLFQKEWTSASRRRFGSQILWIQGR